MACTSRSALEYVKSARCYLVKELTSLSVIVENLNQQGVLEDEEVSKIQAETDDYDKRRNILDKVTRKGEDACYELLKIIDMTRKRTLGRPSLPEKKSVTSTGTKKFDLHYWISCFSFKDDTQMNTNYLQGPKSCHDYQAKLKSNAQNLSNEFWMESKNLFEENNKPNLLYTSLVLDKQENVSPSKIKKIKNKKSKMSRPKKLKRYIPEDKREISPSDLLKTDKNILLIGKPGIGKTAVCHEILRLWAERENMELDYMFYFDMRETSHITADKGLEDLLFGVFSKPNEGKEEVLQDIEKNSDNVTIIFDGITDLPSSSVVQKLVKKDLPYAKIIITCRLDDEEDFLSGDFLRVEVRGFSERTIKTYLSAILGEEQKEVLCNLELLTLCHVPMYALMVAACFSSKMSEDSPQPCTITEIYIKIVRYRLKMNNKTKDTHLNSFISNKREEILSLAEVAFLATEGKTVNLTELTYEDSCVHSFLKTLIINIDHTESIITYAFLHYTMQEFFAALWLLKNPEKIKDVLQQCLTEEKKYMKHLIPFICRLLNDKKYPTLMKCLIPAQELKSTSTWFFKEVITTFFTRLCDQDETDSEDSRLNVDILFLCQCLYESQCPEACLQFLDKLDYHLDLSGESLDPHHCCAVSYVVTQSKERKTWLNLEDAMVSKQGMRRLFGCLKNVQWCDPLPRQLWRIFLLSEEQMDHISLLGLDGNQLHLPVEGERQLFEKAVKVMQKITMKVNVCLYWDRAIPVCQSLCVSLLEALPNIGSLSFRRTYGDPGLQGQERCHETLEREKKGLLLDLCLEAALHKGEIFHNVVNMLFLLFSVDTDLNNILLDFYQHVKSKGCLSDIPRIQQLYQSRTVWSINLSERKASILLEVLKLQSEKKQVELTGWSDEESEVRSLIQCLPYISQLRFISSEGTWFWVNLFCAAAEREQQTGEKILELLSSVCSCDGDQDFLLDLYSQVKDCETKTGGRVLPALQSVFQSPTVWSINLSERKASILLEVLKLQSEKKEVKLTGWSDEGSEVRSFLQCLPYISQLSFRPHWSDTEIRFLVYLFCAAAEREQQTGEKILELLSSVCSYKTFPFKDRYMGEYYEEYQCHFLLDLYSQVKECETKTGRRVLPLLMSVFQSPTVWSINLSERKASILLEVLKLQSEKKEVELTGCSDEESEVRSFLQCLPYISWLSLSPRFKSSDETWFLVNLLCAAAEREQQTGEKILELLSSVCSYDGDQDFLLDLYSQVKDCETKTGRRILPALQSVFQSPTVWSINLSERKASILLEVLKLQSEKKEVKLTGWSDEESEVRSFLQCLPYISGLRLSTRFISSDETWFLVNLFCAAAEREQQTGEKILELLSSVCSYDGDQDFLLDLYSQSPTVWSINLSERKASILLEVLKLQSEKKEVKLTGCSDEESEVRSFLQCLPYISGLGFPLRSDPDEEIRFLVNLFCAAAEREQQTGEKILELLSSVCSYETFPFKDGYMDYQGHFLLGLYCYLKDYETKTGRRVLPALQSVFQSPTVWSINLSERKASILLEVLKLQSEKKEVELTGCSDEESEVRSFLQCLPYISQLSFHPYWSDPDEEIRLLVNLFCAAAEREQQTGEKILELLSSVCSEEVIHFKERYMNHHGYYYSYDIKEHQCYFLLDLYSQMKDYETETVRRVLPALQSVFQSPTVWFINLSERKASILLEVLKLQSEKKEVELTGCSDEESEVRSFLQCLPYISKLSFDPDWSDPDEEIRFLVNLFCAAAEREQQTGEKILELLSSVCSYETFPVKDSYMDDYDDDDKEYQCKFLLGLCSQMKDYETKTGRRVLPALQSVFQSPTVWSINLSKRKASILLEVLKLQSEKKEVELTGCSDEESEVRSFLQCLPYISKLSFRPYWSDPDKEIRLLVNLFCAAAEREQQTGEKILELLSSVCSYETFPFRDGYMDYQGHFLLGLYCHLKDCETKTGRRVLPALQSVFQSPTVWSINLSERKASILLEVLKLQSEKKEVELTGWSDEESEVRSFLQCLPYISKLSLSPRFKSSDETWFLVNLFCAAAEREQQTGEKILELLSSVCSYGTFPVIDGYTLARYNEHQCHFLLDLYSQVKDCETKTGRRVLPALQSVFQSPTVWSINLSERKASILLEVLKLQSEKKEVKLTGCSDEESEVRSFLQCLPFISLLSFLPDWSDAESRFLVNLFCAAAEREQRTGEKILELLSSVCSYETFPVKERYMDDYIVKQYQCYFLLDLYSQMKDCETKTGRRVLPALQSVFQSPTVWFINLSERKASILLEVLKLQSEKKEVQLTGCSDEESEVRSFLQCLPYISWLSFRPDWSDPDEEIRFLVNLFCAAAEREQQTGEKILELLSSVCSYETFPFRDGYMDDQSHFLLGLYCHLKDYETKTGRRVLPALQSVFQSPTVWSINLSKRTASILLEVLKLQSEKKEVKLTGCSNEESEVRSFLQCLPYISKLSFPPRSDPDEEIRLLVNLFCAAAEREQQTGEKILELLSSVCSYETFPFRDRYMDYHDYYYSYDKKEDQCYFLLDLYSQVKDCETKTDRRVLPALQSLFQSPTVWSINLSKRKASILLEVLKLQSQKKEVKLRGCSDEESEVRSFLQCLPYISQLSFPLRSDPDEEIRLLVNLFCAAAEREQQTGEKILELLSSVCSYETFPFKERYMDYQGHFLLGLYCHLKDYETETVRRVLPALQSVFQSPTVWFINLSERKVSILLEVLKLQSEKKEVELTGCSNEESEVRSFLQCLPYISQLSFPLRSDPGEEIRLLVNLFCAAAEREQQTGEKILELLSSLCSEEVIHVKERYMNHHDYYYSYDKKEHQCHFLLDLCSQMKDCETKTDRRVLPALQSLFQSPTVWSINLSERKASILLEVLKLQSEKKEVKLTGCSDEESEVRSFLQCLPYISQLSFRRRSDPDKEIRFLVNLFCAAAEREQQTGEKILELLSSLCSYETFPFRERYMDYQGHFLLGLYCHLKDYETETGRRVLPALQSVFQSPSTVWSINLSKRKASILLEVLKLQSEKKEVKLTGWSDEESEVRSFLQCLPYISKLSFPRRSDPDKEIRFLVNLFCAAAEREQQTGEKILELLSSVCSYETFPFKERNIEYQSHFLLDLYSQMKDYETKTGRRVLPALLSVFQSPTVWSINLSKRKVSILLEVLKLQSEKKEVELTGCSDEESEVRSFLQCLPYISGLSFPQRSDPDEEIRFLVNLFCAAAEREQQTGEKILELLSSVCSYETFPFKERNIEYQSHFLLDLYSQMKDYETKTGRRVLPALLSVFQSPTVWSINLSKRKVSILLEVLKLQSEKKEVELTGCSDEESEVRSFLQCLPYISGLSFARRSDPDKEIRLLVNLFCAAAERKQQTGEKILELLSSVCSYKTFPFKERNIEYQGNFLLGLYSQMKHCETKTGRRVLPALQSVFQSPTVWSINLSERKVSILLEVLKLQSEKKEVKLTGCSDEESEVRSFLQCLPYISQLSFPRWSDPDKEIRFLVNLFCAAAEREQQTGEKILELLSSVCSYETFPFKERNIEYQSHFLLDLYSQVKDCETKTGRRVLPALQSVFQSPTVWSINLSKRKASILLEVLKLQSEKKEVKLTGCSDEESEVRSFLQCLPYISGLSLSPRFKSSHGTWFWVNLLCAAAEREQQTGEKILKLLSSVCSYDNEEDFLLDMYSQVKDCETKTGRRVLPALQSVFQSPTVWSINLSERKVSILLDVLKLQLEKKEVELTGCSDEESEVRSFLQCLPYISGLSLSPRFKSSHETWFLVKLFCAAAEREQQTGEKILKLLSSVCIYDNEEDFLLDLYSQVKDYETKTGRRVLPALLSVFQSPTFWSMNLSERKVSILLEVLKLQSEKKEVKLTGCSDEESEVRSFLQCFPFISQLSFPRRSDPDKEIRFLVNLFCAAAEREQQTGEKILELLSSVCSYETFPVKERNMDDDDDKEYQSHFLLDLYSQMKDCETKTGRRVLPALQSVLQSPTVWSMNLSKRKASILLEVLKLQSEKKEVKLTGCSDEESEVRSFLQCLPYISGLSFPLRSDPDEEIRFLVNLFCAAAEREEQTGEKILELLSSVCSYETFPFNDRYMDDDKECQCKFLLDLYSQVKDCETKTGRRVLPALQSVLQSRTFWSINLSEIKVSILLEVLKLQSEKKKVELIGCSDEESEVRSFLQCLPYISGLGFSTRFKSSDRTRFWVNLLCAAAEREQQTGEKILELLSSVCSYDNEEDFLLDMCSQVKDYETETDRRVLPALQSVFQSPTVWFINLSERKVSILLEVLKLQSEKKEVELTGCSDEESEVRSFLQCLPYISGLSLSPRFKSSHGTRFWGNLLCAAAEREEQTGEKILKLLSSVCIYDDDQGFLLDLYSQVKDCETERNRRVLPALLSVLQSSTVWSINLSEIKASILLEVLKLQSEKKQVELTGCSDEESEVRSLLQCLPYISRLSFPRRSDPDKEIRFLVNLFCAAAEREQQTGEKILELLSSVCSYDDDQGFLLDLYSQVKDCETERNRRVLPALLSVLQSSTFWSINLSEIKVSILLEVLKLQSEKKRVELTGCSDEESEVRSFLQCLPYISLLGFPRRSDPDKEIRFLVNLFCAAAEREQQTGEKILKLLSSVCSYDDDQGFLLDLYSQVKDCETERNRRVLPALLSVLQSSTVWSINLSEIKVSILLEVLKLQSEKKDVELTGCSDEESEVRSLLQCLPYISGLGFPRQSDPDKEIRFWMNLFCAAAEREEQTGEKILELLLSVCSYKDAHGPLLDLYSQVKDCETERNRRVLPALLSVLQSSTVWSMNLSEIKVSILLEVLKLQSEKKQVELTGCSDEESEVRSFLQCLPYISRLSFPRRSDPDKEIRFLGNLFCAAAEREQQTGEKILELLSSVYSYETFPFKDRNMDEDEDENDDDEKQHQCHSLLDLYAQVKDHETKTDRRVLPALQSVFQSPSTIWFINVSEIKVSILLEVLKLQSEKKEVKLTGCSDEESEVRSFLQCLPYISELSFPRRSGPDEEIRFLVNLFCAAAEREEQTGEKILELLSSVCSYETFPLKERNIEYQSHFLLDLYSQMKDYETKTDRRVLPALQSVFQSPSVWFINLSEIEVSILLEVLKLQSEKKEVKLTGCSDEESEVRSFLQCLPYISGLSLSPRFKSSHGTRFWVNLFCAAAEREEQTGEKILKLLSSVCIYDNEEDFLLDMCSQVKDYETKTGRRVLPALLSVFQSPTVWSMNLSEIKVSILLEVLKLQSEKKEVKLTGCSEEESEVRSFLQCLPHISQLSLSPRFKSSHGTRFWVNLLCAAAEREQQTGEKILKLLSSVCSYDNEEDFLLDMYSQVKDYETKTGRRVLPALLSVFQSPTVWSMNLSERKVSILLEVLKLQSEKKEVKLTGCSEEESEVRSFLQCLPHISGLSFPRRSDPHKEIRFLVNLFCAAAEREQQTGEKILELLSSVCSYETFPFKERNIEYQSHFLLDLYSQMKDCETKTGRRVLPALQSVFQSPTVWSINLSERKVSILLEVLKLQSEKKEVKLTGCSDEESEVRSFLQCLPYISGLSFPPPWWSDPDEEIRFLVNLFCAAAEREQQTGEKILELLSSVCSYEGVQDFLLDLYSQVKDCETKTGRRILPALQSVFQSSTVWFINLSKRKVSILLEVLNLQSEKKEVELTVCSDEESEVRSFLQCLPYISLLSFPPWWSDPDEGIRFLVNLFCAAAEREQQTGEKILELLSSVCSYETFPFKERNIEYQSHFLLDLYSQMKDCETKTGRRVLPALQSVFQSSTVWSINLSERKVSILLEVLKLQSEKKEVKLTGCSDEESEVRSFLQCLPYISWLSFPPDWSSYSKGIRFLVNLFCAAAEREQQTGEKILELLLSVCSYDDDDDDEGFPLDLYSQMKDCETETGRRVLPALLSVLQSSTVWFINLSKRKVSILLEVLKLQSKKKEVELTGCSDEESEVRSFLQCLPYISRLSFPRRSDPDKEIRFLGNLFCAAAEREQQTGEKILELLSSVCIYDDDQDFLLDLYSQVKDFETKTGRRVLPALQSVFQSPTVWSINLSERKVSILLEVLKLQSEKKEVELTGCSDEESEVRSFLQCLPYISRLRLNEESLQQLLDLLHEIQDEDLTCSFFSKVGGDLTSCCLNWEVLQYLLQQSSAQTITVNLRKNCFLQERITHLLPFLDRIVFKRPSPSFVLTAIREIHKAQTCHMIPSLLRSLDHVINLTCRELDSVDCAALLFILQHSDRVKVNLQWTSIPTEEIESILFTLDKVSQLSVDRNLLLRFIHCCAASDAQQGAASGLLRTLQHRLDLSCSSCVELTEKDQTEPLSLTFVDCRAVSTILRHSSRDTQMDLRDCEVEDSSLDLLFPVLDRVRLRASKAVLLQLVSLVPGSSERDTVRRGESLCRALGGELDLSHTTLDQRACEGLARMLDFSDGLTELDLSHCQLTDQLLLTLITRLHKVQVLDLSHNKITDAATHRLLQLVSINPSIEAVRLFNNNIVDRTPFKKDKRFEI
ncbi:uncharacterized protein LOC122976244 [Thunnus albacares]|uniref:uncharacterized protein LOC122976244 n=1 Tax=Thunnus albacares TaxID=8236 RepID=UPI001CF62051|nr:uncharacterized protein LOC122976244 [Thunnus albacares]